MRFSKHGKAALGVAVLGFALSAGAARAQDITAQPTYGAAKLAGGSMVAPHMVQLTAGGPLDAWNIGDGGCQGYIASAPDYALRYTAGADSLVIGATAAADTTLVVLGPDGIWWCDDDSGGALNPELTFANPADGNYLIWVGTFSQSAPSAARLSISEGGRGTMLDPEAEPTYGSVALTGGFTPDPHVVNLEAGGSMYAPDAAAPGCRGYVTAAPSYVLDFTPGEALPLIISAGSDYDMTLVVRTPDGTWQCDYDGGNGLNSALTFSNPQQGAYAIWVGTYNSDIAVAAALHISELYSQ